MALNTINLPTCIVDSVMEIVILKCESDQSIITTTIPGADPEFQVRGGELIKIAPSEGRRENVWGISCEKSRFYTKKSYFSNFRGGGGAGAAPPWILLIL